MAIEYRVPGFELRNGHVEFGCEGVAGVSRDENIRRAGLREAQLLSLAELATENIEPVASDEPIS